MQNSLGDSSHFICIKGERDKQGMPGIKCHSPSPSYDVCGCHQFHLSKDDLSNPCQVSFSPENGNSGILKIEINIGCGMTTDNDFKVLKVFKRMLGISGQQIPFRGEIVLKSKTKVKSYLKSVKIFIRSDLSSPHLSKRYAQYPISKWLWSPSSIP